MTDHKPSDDNSATFHHQLPALYRPGSYGPERLIRWALTDDRPPGPRESDIPFRQWPWHKKLVERLYRWTHGGQIRTIVIRRDRG